MSARPQQMARAAWCNILVPLVPTTSVHPASHAARVRGAWPLRINWDLLHTEGQGQRGDALHAGAREARLPHRCASPCPRDGPSELLFAGPRSESGPTLRRPRSPSVGRTSPQCVQPPPRPPARYALRCPLEPRPQSNPASCRTPSLQLRRGPPSPTSAPRTGRPSWRRARKACRSGSARSRSSRLPNRGPVAHCCGRLPMLELGSFAGLTGCRGGDKGVAWRKQGCSERCAHWPPLHASGATVAAGRIYLGGLLNGPSLDGVHRSLRWAPYW